MHLEVDFGSRFDQSGGAVREYITLLADSVLIQKNTLFAKCDSAIRSVRLPAVAAAVFRSYEGGSNVVDRGESLGRDNLNALDVSIFRQMRIDQNVGPAIRRGGSNDHILIERNNHVGLTDLPGFLVFEVTRWRHIRVVALGCASVDPLHDRIDLLVG